MEQTLVLVKGDGVKRRLIGEIISRIENKGLDIEIMQLMNVSRELAEQHYAEHRDKPFFEELVEFITTTPRRSHARWWRRRRKGRSQAERCH